MKIALVTMFGHNYKEIAAVTIPLMKKYATRHQYQFFELVLKDGNDYAYKKHDFFKSTSLWVDVLFYLDIDCAITNHTIKAESFLDSQHDLFITQDKTEINGGSLLLKTTKEGMIINNAILGLKGKYENEQNAIVWLMGDPAFNQFVKILPHPSINSYLYDLYPEIGKLKPQEGQWEEGQFILHTPGLPYEKRIEVLKNAKITE